MEDAGILTIKEVAEYLRVSERTVSSWAQKDEIPCGKFGSSWRFRRADIDRWLDQKFAKAQRAQGAPAPAVPEILVPERILFLEPMKKKETLMALVDCLVRTSQVEDREELASAVFHREELMSTGIGLGVAIPHVRLPSLDEIVTAVAVSRQGIDDYESLDGQPVQMVFMIAAGSAHHTEYLRVLSGLTARIKEEPLRRKLLETADPDEFIRVFVQED